MEEHLNFTHSWASESLKNKEPIVYLFFFPINILFQKDLFQSSHDSYLTDKFFQAIMNKF